MLVAITITSVVIVTVALSLTTPLRSYEPLEKKTQIVDLVSAKMDEVMAKRYVDIKNETDSVTVDGENVNRDVIVSTYDQDFISGAKVKSITVRIGDVQLETLKSNYEHDPNAPPPERV